ncbi:MAG: hypothetical protein SGILL_006868, partial [Bacillariaceae sp.]
MSVQDRALAADAADNTTDSSSPILLSTLPQHQEWYSSHNPDDYQEHGPSDNKLETHTHATTGEQFHFCHLVSMNPFTRNDGATFHEPAYESALAIMLAVQMLNTGSDGFLSGLSLPKECPILFSVEFVDTEFNVGPVSGPTSIITGLEDFVQLSGESTSVDLDDRTQYPRFGRTIPSDAGTAGALVQFLANELHLTHLAILNINDSFGNAYATMIRDAARRYAPDLEIIQIPMDRDLDFSITEDDIARSVSVLKRSQFLYSVVILLDTETHDAFMLEAHKQGLAGSTQHNFLFTDGFDFTSLVSNREFHPDDPLFQAYHGAGIIRASGGLPGEAKFDGLTQKLQELKQSTADMQYVASQLPGNPFLDDIDFFNPLNYHATSFNFDAAILMGLSVCAAATNNDLVLSGTALYNQLSQTSFDGLTGKIVLDAETKTRVANSSYFKIWNLVGSELEVMEGENRTAVFNAPVTHLFSEGQWDVVEGEAFVFNDGTTQLPGSLRAATVETNYLHSITRAVILLFCALAIVSAITCATWTLVNREKRIVRASQPFFLILVCVGT